MNVKNNDKYTEKTEPTSKPLKDGKRARASVVGAY